MEKRSNKTLALALTSGTRCAQFILILSLFGPAFVTVAQFSAAPPVREPPVAAAKKPRELTHIYSIVKSQRSDIEDGEIWALSRVIFEESLKRKLDPLLVLALIRIESAFRYTAVSPSGARGIMQIMPETARSLAHLVLREHGMRPVAFSHESLDDPFFNIRLGTYYLHHLKKRFRNLSLALSAYNAGPGTVQSRLENEAEFSDEFAALVLDAYRRFKNAHHPAF